MSIYVYMYINVVITWRETLRARGNRKLPKKPAGSLQSDYDFLFKLKLLGDRGVGER